MYDDIINELKSNLSFTHGENITYYDSGYIGDVFSEIANNNVDIYTSDLFDWGKNNMYYIDEATKEFGDPHDILKQIQQGQYYAYEQELYENKDDVLKLFTYSYLDENNIVINDDKLDDLDDYVTSLDNNNRLEEIIDYCKSLYEDFEVA